METIGDKIRILRLTKNYSQEYMAFMLEISQAAYSKLERNETEFTVPRIYAIAEILEVSPFRLMPPPKHDTGINQDFIMKTLNKLRKFWTSGLKKKKAEATAFNTEQRDISKTKVK